MGITTNDCYSTVPPGFSAEMNDEWFLSRYRHDDPIVLASGEWDTVSGCDVKIVSHLQWQGGAAWLDVWGDHTGHDWPCGGSGWRRKITSAD